jgi:hypothetical protein
MFVHGDDDHRPAVFDDLELGLAPIRGFEGVAADAEDTSLQQGFRFDELKGHVIFLYVW